MAELPLSGGNSANNESDVWAEEQITISACILNMAELPPKSGNSASYEKCCTMNEKCFFFCRVGLNFKRSAFVLSIVSIGGILLKCQQFLIGFHSTKFQTFYLRLHLTLNLTFMDMLI